MSADLAVGVEHLTKVYGKMENQFAALNDVTFGVEKGEAVAITGKSGSGKSTLMHLMALMDRPTYGTVSVQGKDTATLGKRELDLMRNKTFGFVFQQFFLNGTSTVLDNVILPLKIAGVSRKERNEKGLATLESVELGEKAHSLAGDLSGGQKQRVVIARALINNPEIIFADEPTGNLDSQTGSVIEDMLFSLNKDRHISLVIVTHDPDLAVKCHRQIHIKDGKLVGEAE